MAFATLAGSSVADTATSGLIEFSSGDSPDATDWNQNFRDTQNAARYGLVAGVLSGSECTASLLVVTVPASVTVYVGGQIWVSSGTTTISVADASTSYVWLCSDGELRTSSAADTAPTSFTLRTAALLTKATAAAGVATLDNTVTHWARRIDKRIVSENERGINPISEDVSSGVIAHIPARSKQVFYGETIIDGRLIIDGKARFEAWGG